MKPAELAFWYDCDVCGGKFRFGPHYYGGRKNNTYKIMVCHSCRKSNHDGWAPHYEECVTSVLRKEDLPLPPRNKKGWLPYEYFSQTI